MIRGRKILVTGAGGVAAFPIAAWLAAENEVWGAGRLADAAATRKLEAAGITPCRIDIAAGDLSNLPADFDYVLHFAWVRGSPQQFDEAIRVNAEGTGLVLQHCRSAKAALVISSTAIYAAHPDAYHRYAEGDPLGRAVTPGFNPTSTASKIAQEAVARFCARALNLPVTIARLNTVFGPVGAYQGKHVAAVLRGDRIDFPADPHPHTPIHSDDMKSQVEALLDAAGAPAALVNWTGDEVVTAQAWCRMAGDLTGREPRLGVIDAPGYPAGNISDNARRLSITGPCKVSVAEGMERLVRDVRAATGL